MRRRLLLLAALLLVLGLPDRAHAQQPSSPEETLTLTLDEAVQIALVQNYTVRNRRLDVTNASAQVREAWGQVMPQVDASASYTRNLKTANPFAGSEAGGLFALLKFTFGFGAD